MDALYFFLIADLGRGHDRGRHPWFSASPSCTARRSIPDATQIEGSTLLEATWTIIPLALFLVCFVWGALLYFRIYDPPTNAMNIYIVGKQWMWKAEHPGGQHEIDALHIPQPASAVDHDFSGRVSQLLDPRLSREARSDPRPLLHGLV